MRAREQDPSFGIEQRVGITEIPCQKFRARDARTAQGDGAPIIDRGLRREGFRKETGYAIVFGKIAGGSQVAFVLFMERCV